MKARRYLIYKPFLSVFYSVFENINGIVMKPSLSAFMYRLIDYAGLFPPSRLDMRPAVENFLSYRESEASDMLSAFIIPASRLAELEPYSEPFSSQGPVPFSVITGGGDDAESCLQLTTKGMQQISRFLEIHSGRTEVPTLEIKLPDFDPDEDELLRLCSEIRSLADKTLPSAPDIFFEPVRNQFWRARVDMLTAVLQKMDKASAKNGFKLRCGGVEAHMFPTINQVAAALHACLKRGIPFKGTAGLHHPVRHFNDSVDTKMHGFLNVFGAAVLGKAHGWNEAEIARMLLDEKPENFIFSDTGFSWEGIEATTAQIHEVRSSLASSYGSCSFTEPLEDLETLGLYTLPDRLS